MHRIRLHHALPVALGIVVAVALFALPGWLHLDGTGFPRAVLGAAAVGWLVLGIRLRARAWRVLDTPTTKVLAATVGTCELTGTAIAREPAPAPGSGTESVWFRWELQEHRKRGKHSSWVTVDRREHVRPFVLEDDTGAIVVDPHRAEFHGFRRTRMRVPERGRTWRQLEWRLPDRAQAYVLGPVRAVADAHTAGLEVRAEPGEELLVSDDAEPTVARRLGAWAWLSLALGFAAACAAPIARVATAQVGSETEVTYHLLADRSPAVVAAAVYVAGLAGSWLVRAYNRLVIVRNQAAKAWASIAVQLQRRHDLIGRLVTVVRAHRDYEAETLRELAAVRALHDLPSVDDVDAARAADDRSRVEDARLLALAEAYPVLAADDQFRMLGDALRDTEDRVALARAFYDDAVTVLRDRQGTFPYLLVAPLVDLPPFALFAAGDTPAAAPTLLPSRSGRAAAR